MKKKIYISVLLLVCLIVGCFGFSASADLEPAGPSTDVSILEESVLEKATNWFVGNYGAFYNIRDFQAEIIRTFDDGAETSYTVAIRCQTQLKADSVEELPFVRGLYDGAAAGTGEIQSLQAAVDYYAEEVVDFSKDYSALSLDVVVPVDNVKKDVNESQLFVRDGMETYLYPVSDFELDAEEMYLAGRQSVDSVSELYASVQTAGGYSDYDRIAARDYALTWVGSSVTSCFDHGTSCETLQDRSKWNNAEYPFHETFTHNDCADFVSQAMSAGGLPENGASGTTWFRVKNTTEAAWGAPWTNVISLVSYMTDSSRGYWSSSTYAACNAGNILRTSSEHVVMITLNDTVTHRYTGHTNDRRDYVFSVNSAYEYYVIKAT